MSDDKAVAEFLEVLDERGIHAALGFLNRRTPHRFTGLYRFDGETLRNLYLYDSFQPTETRGEDAPMEKTYCSLVKSSKKLEIKDAEADERVKGKIDTPVMSYCGVLVRDESGQPFGTLCHFDLKRCQRSLHEFAILEEAAKAFGPLLENEANATASA